MDNLNIILAHASILDRMTNSMQTELDAMDLIGEVVRAALSAEAEMRSHAAWTVARTLISAERMRITNLLESGPRTRRKEEELERLTQQYLSRLDAAVNLASERLLRRVRQAVDHDGVNRVPPLLMLPQSTR